MDSIQINTGIKRIAINDDEERMITFNPTDVRFAERFYALAHDLESKLTEYQQRHEALDQVTAVDDNGLPVNLDTRITFMREFCEYIYAQIDTLFGAGTSETVFEGALNPDAITQFFDGLTPFFQRARADKLKPYQAQRGKGKPKAAMK